MYGSVEITRVEPYSVILHLRDERPDERTNVSHVNVSRLRSFVRLLDGV